MDTTSVIDIVITWVQPTDLQCNGLGMGGIAIIYIAIAWVQHQCFAL